LRFYQGKIQQWEDAQSMKRIDIRIVSEWNTKAIRHLYRMGGWWKEEWDPEDIRHLISGSLAFAVGIDQETGETIAMGRVISDGASDAYLQDVIVLKEYRRQGIGQRLIDVLISACENEGISWIGLIAEPGTEKFYIPAGFSRMEGYVPMIYAGTKKRGGEDVIKE
jgi:aralkylamine N-acetyltransferase